MLEAARARGQTGGRKKKSAMSSDALAVDLYRQKNHTVAEFCR